MKFELKMISGKLIFSSLLVILIMSFVIISFVTENKTIIMPIKKMVGDEQKKILGARIYQQNKKGEKIFIIAETLQESKTENNKVILENSLTTINSDGIISKIYAGHAIVSNNFEDFNFSNNVKITKESRKFTLNTETLIGSIEKGNFHTDDNINIISGNTKINGKGLDLKRNGEYIKIKGKAKLIMFLSKKNAN